MNQESKQTKKETPNTQLDKDNNNKSTPLEIEYPNNENNENFSKNSKTSNSINTLNVHKPNQKPKKSDIPETQQNNQEISQNRIIEETPNQAKSPLSLLNGPDLSSEENLLILKNIYQNTLKKQVDLHKKNGEWFATVEGKDFQLTILNNYIKQILQSGGNGMTVGKLK